MILKLISYLIFVAIALGSLAACVSVDELNPFSNSKSGPPNCPKIKFLKNADTITVYKTGAGKDLRDIKFEAEMTSFKGECEYIGDKGVYNKVIVTLQIGIDVTRGPAENTGRANLKYFVAIPDFFPNPEGKVSFNRVVIFPHQKNSVALMDEAIEIVVPLNKNRQGPQTEVLIGFELSKNQLEFNRNSSRNRGLGK